MNFGFPTETVSEGSVSFIVPKPLPSNATRRWGAPSKAPVFYNPRMALNRDIAVLALRAYKRTVRRGLRVCEPMAGSGVRGIRFAVEVGDVELLVMNDLNPEASRLAMLNVERNRLSGKVIVENLEANTLMTLHSSPKKRFDYIDIDPFGSPAPFIDSAIRALIDGGMIALTATDMAPLCGVHPEACLRKYGGWPLRTEYCHELAVRLLISCLSQIAARHEFGVNVLFSHSTDHYIRIYAKTRRGAAAANISMGKVGYVLHCFRCLHRRWFTDQAHLPSMSCERCGERMGLAGPLWLGEIFDSTFVPKMRNEAGGNRTSDGERVKKLLDLALVEADGPPTYYVTDKVSERLQMAAPAKSTVIRKLLENGYRATPTHFNLRGIKSDAQIQAFEEAVRGA